MHVLIVEDEAVIARRLVRLTRAILGKRLACLRTAENLDAAFAAIAQRPIDLLLLDLNLHGRNGFDLLQQVVVETFHTIIVSAHTDRAIRAFEYGVLDFVPKPFDRERLAKAFARFTDASSRADFGLRYIGIAKNAQTQFLAIDRIHHVRGAGPYAELNLMDGRVELYSKSLDRLMMILPPSFARIHRSYIANMDQALAIQVKPGSRYQLAMRGRISLPIGRTRVNQIRQKLNGEPP